mmetsp:Transcript_9090/g.11378  ORF Transcript_9090/g.11378 Transcript_9090/m.11378 type:complete len:206 (-) Transcript_9090:118-735(-)
MYFNHMQLLCFITGIFWLIPLIAAAPSKGTGRGKVIVHNLRKTHEEQITREVTTLSSNGTNHTDRSDDSNSGGYYYDSNEGSDTDESAEEGYYDSEMSNNGENGSGNNSNSGGSDGGYHNNGNSGATGSAEYDDESYTDKLKKYLRYRAEDGYQSTPISWNFEEWAFMVGLMLLFGTAYTLCCMTLVVPCYCPGAVRFYARTFLR